MARIDTVRAWSYVVVLALGATGVLIQFDILPTWSIGVIADLGVDRVVSTSVGALFATVLGGGILTTVVSKVFQKGAL